MCTGVHAPRARAQVDTVEPDLEDFLFGEVTLQPHGEHQLLHLAAQRAGIAEEQVLRDLLCTFAHESFGNVWPAI